MDVQEFQPTRQLHRGRRGALILLLAISSVATLGSGLLSLALFTDSASSTGGFSTGSIDINTDTAVLFTVPAMFPDDTEEADLVVSNDGTGELRYAMSTVAPNGDGKNLGGQLELTVYEGTCAAKGAAVVSSATLNGAGFGSAVAGPDGGDRVLAAGTDESFCFSVWLPDTTDYTFMGATTTATFTFDAEQTANNP